MAVSRPRFVRSAALTGAAFIALTGSAFAQAGERYAAIVIDAQSNEVLLQEQADEQRYPASLTKMMTLYMLFDALERGQIGLEDRIVASRAASRMPPSRLGVRRGDTLTVEQAIGALVVQSANDVAVMVAERLGGTESNFAARMTARAQQIGLTNTRFVNASGLPDPRIRTTARDMAALSLALWRDYPQYYHYFQTPSNAWRGRSGRNHNRLLGAVDGVDGIKTGYTRVSGYNLASSAERGGRRIIAVVLGGETAAARDAQVAYLLEGGFEELSRRGLIDPSAVTFTSLPTNNVNARFNTQGQVSAVANVRPGFQAAPAMGAPLGPLRGPFDNQPAMAMPQGDAGEEGDAAR
ncbi:MAG: D-alanyl-D-alanine carboxypeptidase [Hyphomonadaceae bacterium]|nr:D-alanyl-D-alanine carboxypeptidase [Hyphomonadaceae bacterium]